MNTNLPPELSALAQIVDAQPPEMQELFQYTLAMLLVEDGKATIVGQRTIDRREWTFGISTAGHEQFSVVKPNVADDVLAHLRGTGRGALREE